MNKFLFAFLACLFLLLVGCESFPQVSFHNSNFRFDNTNRVFYLEKGYTLSESNPYDIIDTENGYDMVLHFEVVGD